MLKRSGKLAAGAIIGYVSYKGPQSTLEDVQGVGRASLAFSAVALTAADYEYNLREGRERLGDDRYFAKREECHRRGAERAARMCRANGGMYIKAAQFFSCLAGVPQAYATALSKLQDAAPPMPLSVVAAVIERELGRPLDAIFDRVDEEPLAAGSLAVVHRARLKGPEEQDVAVKVQRPGLERQFDIDLSAMALVTSFLHKFTGFDLRWAVPEMRERLVRELDFSLEARCAERVREAFQDEPCVKVPGVLHSLSSPCVLTMEHVTGVRVDDIVSLRQNGLNPRRLASIVSHVFGRMFTCVGFLHGDPHPGSVLPSRILPVTCHMLHFLFFFSWNELLFSGNLLARRGEHGGEQLCLLDHGLFVELDESFRRDICRFWRAVAIQDWAELHQLGVKLGAGSLHWVLPLIFAPQLPPARRREGAARETSGNTNQRVRSLSGEDVAGLMASLPRETGVLLRANALARNLVRHLGQGDRSVERERLFALARFAVLGLQGRELRPVEKLPWDTWLSWQLRCGVLEARFRVMEAALLASRSFVHVRRGAR